MLAATATKNLQRVHGRGLLLSALEEDSILTSVRVFSDGHFKIKTKSWDEYWRTIHELGHEKLEENLDTLHIAWNNYIRSGFHASLRQNFCYCYFTLLDTLFSLCEERKAQEWLTLLQNVLGFECFGISLGADNDVLAAGTGTLRNPCYLLAKLKMPTALDEPQFLPVITAPNVNAPELFYHYRQYTLSSDSAVVASSLSCCF